MFRLSSWKPRHLLAAWVVYWAGLVAAAVAPAIPTIIKLMGAEGKGSTSAGFGDQGLTMSITVNSVEVWSRIIPGWLVLISISVPPLVLWALWLRAQKRQQPVAPGA